MQYVEARIEPGDTVTVVGRALPFGALADPSEADMGGGEALPADDPEVTMNIAEAREAGILLSDPALAWGNAAIPGFGIGSPVRDPELDPMAQRAGARNARCGVADREDVRDPAGATRHRRRTRHAAAGVVR